MKFDGNIKDDIEKMRNLYGSGAKSNDSSEKDNDKKDDDKKDGQERMKEEAKELFNTYSSDEMWKLQDIARSLATKYKETKELDLDINNQMRSYIDKMANNKLDRARLMILAQYMFRTADDNVNI